MTSKYTRILLKISGEALMGEQNYGIDPEFITKLSKEIKTAYKYVNEIAIVIGGGNIFRGIAGANKGMDRSSADYVWMLATIMNAVSLQDSLEKIGLETRVMTALDIPEIGEKYIRRRAIRHLEKKRIVILGAGIGNPFFTTDSAAALRAVELDCNVLLKATNVDGIYDKDPKKNIDAKKYKTISYQQVIEKNLKVMDLTAITMCKDNIMPLVVFNLNKKDNLSKAFLGEPIGTKVTP